MNEKKNNLFMNLFKTANKYKILKKKLLYKKEIIYEIFFNIIT
jgi:hypothetical protein